MKTQGNKLCVFYFLWTNKRNDKMRFHSEGVKCCASEKNRPIFLRVYVFSHSIAKEA